MGMLQVSVHVVEALRLIVIDVARIALRRLHEYAINGSVDGSLLHLVIVLGQFTANFHLLAPVNTILFVATAASLLADDTFLVFRRDVVQSRMNFLALIHTVRAAISRYLLDIRQDHDIAILVIIIATPVSDAVIYRVPLLAAAVQALADGDLARLLSFGRLYGEFLLIQ